MNLKNKKGFSLIEVMTVVGIIAVVSLIAIPNYQRFNAKAKQANAKAELASIYGMQIAFNQEFESYHPNLFIVGYTPDGWPATGGCPNVSAGGPTRYYRTGFHATPGAPVGAATSYPQLPAGCAGAFSYAATSTDTAISNAAAVVVGTTSFLLTSEGQIRGGGAQEDRWTINQNKLMLNTQIGY